MKEQQIILVKRSWRIFRQIDPHLVGGVFYEKLFADQPTLQRMFKTSIQDQSQKLIDMLSAIVTHLDDWAGMQEEVTALGIRHAGYGVKAEHYKAVETALLWTLQQGLGSDWHEDIEEAWKSCIGALSNAMAAAKYGS